MDIKYFCCFFSSCRLDDSKRMEQRERDKLARAMMTQQVQNPDGESSVPLFAAPVRVSSFGIYLVEFFLCVLYKKMCKNLRLCVCMSCCYFC